jgi:hypothetical protein
VPGLGLPLRSWPRGTDMASMGWEERRAGDTVTSTVVVLGSRAAPTRHRSRRGHPSPSSYAFVPLDRPEAS